MAEITHEVGAILAVDSTFATPVVSLPLALGADLVVHSLSKFIGGHGDALGGAIVGRADVIDQLRNDLAIRLGGVLSPFDAWLILRGSETLELRMRACCDSASRLASYLESHPFVTRVLYPGLPSHPQHALVQAQMHLPGAMLAFAVPDPQAFGRALAERGRLVTYATSLGLTRTVILYCDTADLQRTTYRFDEAHLARYREWANDGVFRLSPGLEDPADLIAELDEVLSVAAARRCERGLDDPAPADRRRGDNHLQPQVAPRASRPNASLGSDNAHTLRAQRTTRLTSRNGRVLFCPASRAIQPRRQRRADEQIVMAAAGRHTPAQQLPGPGRTS